MDLGTLYVRLNANAANFVKGMEGAARSVESFAKKMKEISEPIAGAAAMMTAMGGASIALAASVDDRASRSLQRLKSASELLAVQVSDVLEPAVKALSADFRAAANFVAGLDSATKASIATWALWVVGLGTAAKAIGLLSSVVASVASVIAGLAGALGTTSIAAVAILAAVATGLVVLHKAWREDWGGMREVSKEAIGYTSTLMKDLGADIYAALVFPIRVFLDGLIQGIDYLQKMREAIGSSPMAGLDGAREGLVGLRDDIKSGEIFKVAARYAKSAGEEAADATKREVTLIGEEVSKTLKSLVPKTEDGEAREPSQVQWDVGEMGTRSGMTGAEGWLNGIMSKTMNVATDGGMRWVAALNSVTQAFENTQTAIKNKPWVALIESMGPAFTKAKAAWEAFLGRQTTFAEQSRLATAQAAGAVNAYPKTVQRAMRQDDPSKTWKDLNASQRTAGNLIKRVGASMLGNLGALGEMVNAVKDGMEAGGIWGAMVAAAMTVAKRMDGFQRMLKFFEEGLNKLAEFFGPILGWIWDFISEQTAVGTEIIGKIIKALSPIFEAIGEVFNAIGPILGLVGVFIDMLKPALEAFGKAIGAIIKALGPVIKIIFDVIKWILVIIGAVIGAILEVVNKIMQFVAWVIELFGDRAAASEMRSNMTNMSEYWDGLVALADTTWDAVDATNAETVAKWDAKIAADEMAASARKAAEELTNVPGGYKVALARYNAMDAVQLGGGGVGSISGQKQAGDGRNEGVPIDTGPDTSGGSVVPETGTGPHEAAPGSVVVQGDLNVTVPDPESASGFYDRVRIATAQRTGSYYTP